MFALLACLMLTGCDKSQPAASPEATPAPEAAVGASVAPEAAEDAALPEQAPEAALTLPELSEEEAGAVLATVNGEEITEGDVDKVIRTFVQQMGDRVEADKLEAALPMIRERIVEELLMRRVMLAEVARTGISLSDSEFDEIKGEIAAELPPGMTLAEYLEKTGMTETEMREQMTVRKMVMAAADQVAKPTDEEIKAYYEDNKDSFSQGESVTAAHILIKVDPSDSDADKEAKLKDKRPAPATARWRGLRGIGLNQLRLPQWQPGRRPRHLWPRPDGAGI